MKVYVAGSSHPLERPRVRRAMDAVVAAGHELTCDWLAAVEAHGDAPLTYSDRVDYSWQDIGGVWTADWLWLLAPGDGAPSTGAWVEFGFALACGVPVVCSGPSGKCIFAAVTHEFETDEDVIAAMGEPVFTRLLRPVKWQLEMTAR